MRYDSDLQMFCEEPREPDYRQLAYLRWLIERGMLEHLPAGRPSGPYAQLMSTTGSTR